MANNNPSGVIDTLVHIDMQMIKNALECLHPDRAITRTDRKLAYIRLLQRIGCLPPQGFPHLQEFCQQEAKKTLKTFREKPKKTKLSPEPEQVPS